jgi:HEAT repeat protein
MLVAAAALAVLCGCKPNRAPYAERSSTEMSEQKPEVTATLTPPMPANTISPATANDSDDVVRSTEQSYLASNDTEQKLDMIGQLSDIGDVDAVAAFDRLLRNERSTDLKLELLSGLMAVEADSPEKVAALAIGLWPTQPDEVRHLALEGIASSRTPTALQLLQGLRLDANAEIREEATSALEEMRQQPTP